MKKIKIFIVVVIILLSYEFIHYILNLDNNIIPSITSIIKALFSNIGVIVSSFIFTTFEALLGLTITIILSIILIYLILVIPGLRNTMVNFLSVIQMIPIVAIAPLVIIWFGIGLFPKILLLVFYSLYPIIVSVIKQIHFIDQDYEDYFDSLRAGNIQKFKYLYFYFLKKPYFAGLKISLTYLFVITITLEYLGSKYGVGLLLQRANNSFNVPLVFVITILIILETILMIRLFEKFQKGE